MCVTCACSDISSVTITDAETGVQIPIMAQASAVHVHEHEHVDAEGRVHRHSHASDHAHDHDHGHEHVHSHGNENTATLYDKLHANTIALERQILAKNQLLAERNRGWLAGREIRALDMVSSPGSGKTMLA